MKKILNYILVAAVVVFSSTGCSDYVGGDVNVSPNSATDAPVNSIITAAQTNLMGLFEGEDARMGAMWAQQFTGFERQYLAYDEYVVSSEAFSWFQPYVGVIQPCNDALDRLATRTAVSSTEGMLKIMKAMIFGNLAALYGDIPFTQANQPDEFPTPIYDSQTSVYAGLQSLLDDAISDLNAGGDVISFSDIIGNKSKSNWIKVANTLKARFYLHTGDFASAVTYANLGLQPGDHGLVAEHGNVASGNVNLWWDFVFFSRSGYLTAYTGFLPKLLDADEAEYRGDAKTDETDRFDFYFTGDAPGNYEPNITDGGMFGQTSSYPILTGEENQLILAEALMKIGAPDLSGALDALNSVRDEHANNYPGGTYDQYVLTDFDPTGIAGDALKTQAEALLDEIIEEKYCTLIGTIEVFNDLRRLGNPFGLTPRGTGGAFPERFLIPTSEVNTNPNTPNPIPGLFSPTSVN